jgi:hypothetical protein
MTLHALVIVCDRHAARGLLPDAIALAAGGEQAAGETYVDTVIPLVVPATLPINAQPPRLVAELDGLRAAAVEALWALGVDGRAEVVPCRSLRDLVATAALHDHVVLVGSAGRLLTRRLQSATPALTTLAAPRRHRWQRRSRLHTTTAAPIGSVGQVQR